MKQFFAMWFTVVAAALAVLTGCGGDVYHGRLLHAMTPVMRDDPYELSSELSTRNGFVCPVAIRTVRTNHCILDFVVIPPRGTKLDPVQSADIYNALFAWYAGRGEGIGLGTRNESVRVLKIDTASISLHEIETLRLGDRRRFRSIVITHVDNEQKAEIMSVVCRTSRPVVAGERVSVRLSGVRVFGGWKVESRRVWMHAKGPDEVVSTLPARAKDTSSLLSGG